MAILISVQSVSKAFTLRPLFTDVSFTIESGQRIGLIGPNGAGKSTLLSILAGETPPDSGSVATQRGLRVGYLKQVPNFSTDGTVETAILEGSPNPTDWEEIARVHELMAKLSFYESGGITGETLLRKLSGGWKKRVALARELLKQPEVFLLDEPTNHLDVESILWLERFLAEAPFATVTITHDRAFLQTVSNRVLELDRRHAGGLLSIKGDYATFLAHKQELLSSQESREVKLRNTLRREEEWLRRGPKARTTKQEARIERAGQLAGQVEELKFRNTTGKVELDLIEVERNPKKLLAAEGISFSYQDKMIVSSFDLLLTPKSRVGIIGANGSGKSTLIKLLLKKIETDTGNVFHSDNLLVSYFEQNRDSLEPKKSVLKTICPSGEHLFYNGTRIHVRSYLEKFLFTQQHAEMPVERLSGGEQSRLLLARLLLEPANLLVLDEPTNDLDMSTLDILVEMLQNFNGAVLLVSHDRYFLDQVSNKVLGFGTDNKGQQEIISFSSLTQWEEWHASREERKKKKAIQAKSEPTSPKAASKKQRLGFKETRELANMEENIAKAEARLQELSQASTRPEVISDGTKLLEITSEMSELEKEVERLFARWAELEALGKA